MFLRKSRWHHNWLGSFPRTGDRQELMQKHILKRLAAKSSIGTTIATIHRTYPWWFLGDSFALTEFLGHSLGCNLGDRATWLYVRWMHDLSWQDDPDRTILNELFWRNGWVASLWLQVCDYKSVVISLWLQVRNCKYVALIFWLWLLGCKSVAVYVAYMWL